MGNKLSIKTIVAIGIGAAVFMILGRFGSIPSGIPNTNIETCYAFLALMAIIYGPIAGISIGFSYDKCNYSCFSCSIDV